MSNTAGLLGDIQAGVGIIGTAATTVALTVGGIWAYFKFVKGRTYRPRLEVKMSGQWRHINETELLHARVTVRNIGNSVVTLLQKGTGLRVSVLSADQQSAPAALTWTVLRVFEIFGEHEWIEPGETVSDDVLLDLGVREPVPVRFESRLVWQLPKRGSDGIVVFARQIVPVSSILEGSAETPADDPLSATEAQREFARAGAETTESSAGAATATTAASAG